MNVMVDFCPAAENTPARLLLAGELTIYTVAALKQQLAVWSRQLPTATALDLAGVTDVDTAGLQLLLKMRQHCKQRSSELTLSAISGEVKAVLARLHLTQLFSGETRQ